MLPVAAEPPALVCAAPVIRQDLRQACRALPAMRRTLALGVYRQLGWNWARAGGSARADASMFYDQFMERRDTGWCLVYRMKHPFTGEMSQCGPAVRGAVGYAPGVLTWAAAGQRICALVASETGTPCGNNGVEILRTSLHREGAALHYRVVARRHVRDHPELADPHDVPVEYENRTYRLSLDGSRQRMLARKWELCGRSCVRLR